MRSWGRLFRLSLLPSAAADVLAGLVAGGGGQLPGAAPCLLLILASLGIYHGGMAANDWADRAHDRATRADRPLPSGAIPAAGALAAALGLTLAGLVCALLLERQVALWMAAVALAAWIYNLRGRGPWSGPLLLGLCRAGNLGAGIALVALRAEPGAGPPPASWSLAVLYGAYVFTVSRLGRMEDGEESSIGNRPRSLLRLAALLLLAPALVPALPAPLLGRALALAIGLAGAVGLWRRAASAQSFGPAQVGAAMGLCLRRLLIFSCACAALYASATSLTVAATILAGYPLAFWLRSWFPPS